MYNQNLAYGFNSTIEWAWDDFIGKHTRDYTTLLEYVYEDVNYNESILAIIPGMEYFQLKQVRNILNAYANIMINETVVNAFKLVPYNPNLKQPALMTLVQKASGQNADLTKKVLDRLYYLTIGGRISTTQFLDPRTYAETHNLRTTPTDWKDEGNLFSFLQPAPPTPKEKSILQQAIDLGQTVLLAIGGIAVLAFGYYAWSSAKGRNGSN